MGRQSDSVAPAVPRPLRSAGPKPTPPEPRPSHRPKGGDGSRPVDLGAADCPALGHDLQDFPERYFVTLDTRRSFSAFASRTGPRMRRRAGRKRRQWLERCTKHGLRAVPGTEPGLRARQADARLSNTKHEPEHGLQAKSPMASLARFEPRVHAPARRSRTQRLSGQASSPGPVPCLENRQRRV
jgi:hypothetical protein